MTHPRPLFADFAPPIRPQTDLRRAITDHCRTPEPQCLPPLLAMARMAPEQKREAAATARKLIEALRAKHKGTGVQGLVHE